MPVELLKDKNIVQLLSKLSYPFIRAVDKISGEKAAIRVDLQCTDGYNAAAIFSHERLAQAVGTAINAFVLAVLEETQSLEFGILKRRRLTKVDAGSILTTLFAVSCSASIEDVASLDYDNVTYLWLRMLYPGFQTAYVDIADHEGFARRAKSYKNKAIAAGVPAITNAGANPGVSSLMAATFIHNAQRESKGQPERLRYHYFTTGSGGNGPGVLATCFYLIADEVVTYYKGAKMMLKPYSDKLSIDFGEGIGNKDVFLMNVSELASTHEVFGVPTINAWFGTAPFFWNWTLSAFIKLMPVELLKDKNIVQLLSKLSYPFIRAVDKISGEKAAISLVLCINGRRSFS
ncbi:hypothetical protein OROGR_025321 [Orobanche gracilis]